MTVFGKKYLRNPQQLQNLEEGEAWGPHALAVDFVGGPYLIQGLNEKQWKLLREHFSESVRDPDTLDSKPTVLQIYKAEADGFLEITKRPWIVSFDFAYQQDQIEIAGYRSMARVTLDPQTYGMLWTSDPGTEEFPSNIVENYFRVLVSYRLIRTGGMLIHSAGIVDKGMAYLFPGRSGDGKSTLSRISLSEDREVLSDDMNALTWDNDSPMLEKVPFAGDLGHTWTRSSSYHLAGIFSLHKQNHAAIFSMSTAECLSLLVGSAPFLNCDPYRLPQVMGSLSKLVSLSNPNALGFSANKPVWPIITDFLTKQQAQVV